MVSLSSCDLVAGVFEAGFYTAIIIIVIIVIVIIWLINRFRRR